MAGHWNQRDVPHKGWILATVIDVREEGQEEWETDYETCMMCGNEKIRYVHIVTHPEIEQEYRVGCVCAEKMTGDYVNPEKRENELRNRANRRNTWVNKAWRRSRNGNYYDTKDGHHLVIYRDKRTQKFKIKIDERFGSKSHENLDRAKAAMFNAIEHLKEKGDW